MLLRPPNSGVLLALFAALCWMPVHATGAGAAEAGVPPLEPIPLDQPLTPTAEAAFRILFDGRTGGISSGWMRMGFGDLLFSFLESEGGRITDAQSSMGALYRRGRYVWTDDGLLSGAVAFLEPGGFEVVEQVQPAPLIRTDHAVLFQGAHDPDLSILDFLERSMKEQAGYGDAIRLQGVLTRYRNAVGAEAWVAQGPGTLAEEELVPDPTAWEVRINETVRIDGEPGPRTLYALSRTLGEGTRRKATIDHISARGDVPTIYVSAGEAVEGRSFQEGEAYSLDRPLSWAAYGDSGLRFIAPGRAELLGGIDKLVTEAEGAGVTVLSANLLDAKGNKPFAGAQLVELGPVAVAFVGLTDPGAYDQLDETARGTLTIEDPGPAATRALRALRARTDRQPDLVVLLAGFESSSLGALTPELTEMDVVIGDFCARSTQAESQVIQIDPERSRRNANDRRAALVVHSSGAEVGELVGKTRDGRLVQLTYRTHPISQLKAADEEVLQPVMAIRQRVYLEGEEILIPSLRELVEEDINRLQFLLDGQPYRPQLESELATGTLAVDRLQIQMTRELFANLTANMLLRRSAVDVVILPALPWPFSLSGPTRDLYASAYLAVPDTLRLYELTGAQLKELLRVTGDARNADNTSVSGAASRGDANADQRTGAPWIAGLNTAHSKIGGRSISNTMVYRVLTTDRLTQLDKVPLVLSGIKPRTTFVQEEGRFRPGSRGETLTLRNQAQDCLQEFRDTDPEFGEVYRRDLSELLQDRGEQVWPLFYANAETLGLTLTRYLVEGDQDAYANVRESRVTTAESFIFGLRAKGGIGVDTRDMELATSTEAVLSLNTVGDDEPTELEDDLQFALEAGLKGLSVRSVPIYPYLQGAFDSEFMRADETDDDGVVIGKQPRQKDLRGLVGVKASDVIPTVKKITAGSFLEYDFSATEGALESGMALEIHQELNKSPVKWANALKLYGWFPTDDDTDEDLLITLNFRSELGVNLTRNLAFKTYADLLVYRGKVESTSSPGLSTVIGVELAYSGKLQRKLWR